MQNTSLNIPQNVAALLCYVLGWVTGLIFILIEQENRFVRFHAWQSFITFGLIALATIIFRYIPLLGWAVVMALGLTAFVLWVVLMVKAYQNEYYKLPFIGDIAERQQ